MSDKSNDQGRAFEYKCLITLYEEIQKFRPAVIEENSSYFAAQRAWNKISDDLRPILAKSAAAAVETLFDFEPLIIEDGEDQLDLLIQSDSEGITGDVRDILIIRRNICWEIGLSLKHNHYAVKHSRLSKTIDFGERWYGVKCSEQYWEEVAPVFSYLEQEQIKGKRWRDIPNKSNDVYVPILNAFINELNRSYDLNKDVPRKMVEYLLGEYDFYKVISVDSKHMAQISSFNLHGTLNKPGKYTKPKEKLPVATLPTRIAKMELKPGSKTTIELYMDGGWQFSFRIHSAETYVIPSLKFDIQIVGMPTTIMTVRCDWK